jgi:hypothetical protein
MKITIQINDSRAAALAEAIRWSGFSDWRRLTISDEEAYAAQYAAEDVRRAIQEAGNDTANKQ